MKHELLQLKIAEETGWTFHPKTPNIDLSYNSWTDPKGKSIPGDIEVLPNWPDDRNASYELVKDLQIGSKDALPLSAEQECLEYLFSEGWRRVECPNEYCEDGEVLEGDEHRECGVCSGKGGEFERVK